MKYIRTEDGRIKNKNNIISYAFREDYISPNWNDDIEKYLETKIIAEADTIEELCDYFIKIKRKGNCKPYLLKFDHKDLPKLKEQAIKYKDSTIYGAIHVEDKGLIYKAKMKGILPNGEIDWRLI